MKLFINRYAFVLLSCVGLMACSAKEEESAAATYVPQVEKEIAPAEETISPAPAAIKPVVTPTPTPVVKPSVAKEVTQLQAWDQQLQTLKTSFQQITSYDGTPISSADGVLYYDKKRNLLRLDWLDLTDKPEQSAITDKQKILILDDAGKEITTLSWKEWQQGQPNQALFDFGNYKDLLARHQVVVKDPYTLELTPKGGDNYTLYITLSKEDYFPIAIKVVSDLTVTEALLSNTQKNQTLSFETFRAGGLFK